MNYESVCPGAANEIILELRRVLLKWWFMWLLLIRSWKCGCEGRFTEVHCFLALKKKKKKVLYWLQELMTWFSACVGNLCSRAAELSCSPFASCLNHNQQSSLKLLHIKHVIKTQFKCLNTTYIYAMIWPALLINFSRWINQLRLVFLLPEHLNFLNAVTPQQRRVQPQKTHAYQKSSSSCHFQEVIQKLRGLEQACRVESSNRAV